MLATGIADLLTRRLAGKQNDGVVPETQGGLFHIIKCSYDEVCLNTGDSLTRFSYRFLYGVVEKY
jgi:hypothetical protein